MEHSTASQAVMDVVYGTMVKELDCGPFDGGCVAFALAMRRLHGGDVYVLVGRTLWNARSATTDQLSAQHAILRLPDGRFLDASGCGRLDQIVESFSRAECLGRFDLSAVRPIEPEDLPEASRDERVVALIAALLIDTPVAECSFGSADDYRFEPEAPMAQVA